MSKPMKGYLATTALLLALIASNADYAQGLDAPLTARECLVLKNATSSAFESLGSLFVSVTALDMQELDGRVSSEILEDLQKSQDRLSAAIAGYLQDLKTLQRYLDRCVKGRGAE